jgi:hypothetical protein
MKKIVLGILAILIIAYIIFDKVGDAGLSKEFLAKQDSLVHAVDSMKLTLAVDSAKIDSLNQVDVALVDKIAHTKAKVVTVTKVIEVEKNKISSFKDHELISYFNTRYPKDTITNKLPIAQPVLLASAKDLAELDGAKQIITIKDSVIAVTEARVSGKDSVIAVYIKKEGTYKNIMTNQDTQIKDWKNQYQQLYLQNQKLKFKNKITKIGAGLVAGGLVYLMIAK